MVHGIGVDIVEIGRIEQLLKKYGNNFWEKIYTYNEITYCLKMARPAPHFAGRWAVKEAFYKALPFSCQWQAQWKSIEYGSEHENGKPGMTIVCPRLQELMKRCGIHTCHVSLSHERHYCVAYVLLE
ncbi:MAG: holo-ACP synthase [Chitinivibrionales bacterium]|nr:holo-ACP synthase [Chitinivibrionales bacterium]